MNKRLARFLESSRDRPNYRKKVLQSDVSADLRILIAESGRSFKDIAMEIGISPAALSKKLGGETNLTLDSISNIADVVGATFDVVFRPKNAPRAKQTWESAGSPKCGAGQASGIVEEVRTFGHTNQSVKSFLSGGRRGALRKQETLFKPFAAGNIETPVASGHVEFRCEGLLVANG